MIAAGGGAATRRSCGELARPRGQGGQPCGPWVGWPLGRLVSVIRLSPQSRDTSGADKRGRRGAVIWPLGECQLAFSTQPIHLVTHPRHRPRDTHHRDREQPANALQSPQGADQAGCVRDLCRADAREDAARRTWVWGHGAPLPGTCIPGVPDAAERPRLRLDAPAALARARVSDRRPIERASPPLHRLLGRGGPPTARLVLLAGAPANGGGRLRGRQHRPSRHRSAPRPPRRRAGPSAKREDDAPLARGPALDGARAVTAASRPKASSPCRTRARPGPGARRSTRAP